MPDRPLDDAESWRQLEREGGGYRHPDDLPPGERQGGLGRDVPPEKRERPEKE